MTSDRTPLDPAATLYVTRPAHDAGSLIEALRARGRTVVAMPLIGIEAVDDASALADTMRQLERYRVVVFVSPNAIRHALEVRGDPWPAGVTIGVMGPGSVETLRTIGIAAPRIEVVSPASGGGATVAASDDRFDSEALFASLDRAVGLTAGFRGRVLILRGNGGRAWFADRLRDLGIAVDEVEAYRRIRPDVSAAAATALVRSMSAHEHPVFLVTSSEGVDNLVAMVVPAIVSAGSSTPDAARAWLLACGILAPHRRIVEKAREAGFSAVSLCAPGDRGILAAIE